MNGLFLRVGVWKRRFLKGRFFVTDGNCDCCSIVCVGIWMFPIIDDICLVTGYSRSGLDCNHLLFNFETLAVFVSRTVGLGAVAASRYEIARRELVFLAGAVNALFCSLPAHSL